MINQWRGVRVVEGDDLESRCRGDSTAGSNPALSVFQCFEGTIFFLSVLTINKQMQVGHSCCIFKSILSRAGSQRFFCHNPHKHYILAVGSIVILVGSNWTKTDLQRTIFSPLFRTSNLVIAEKCIQFEICGQFEKNGNVRFDK